MRKQLTASGHGSTGRGMDLGLSSTDTNKGSSVTSGRHMAKIAPVYQKSPPD